MKFYTNLGKFDFSGIAPGGGHAVSIEKSKATAIPAKRQTVTIDMAQVAELQQWSAELREKFNDQI